MFSTSSNVIMFITIVLYLGLMVGIGIYYTRRNKSADDFYLGGRKLGPLVTAMSAEASDMSSYLLMGVPGVAYLTGLADASWTAIGLAVGSYLNWLSVAKRLRCYSVVADNAITLPAFFSNRYKDKNRILTLISALVIIIFFVPYTASGFAACGKLFSGIFGTDYMTAMVISAVVIVLYTSLGGFFAASITDLIQSIIMSFVIIFVLVFGTVNAGGIGAVIENAIVAFEGKAYDGAKVLVSGNISPEKYISCIGILREALINRDIEILEAPELLTSAVQKKLLSGCDIVLLLEERDVTKYKEMGELLDIIKLLNKRVIGCLLY